MWVSAAAVKKVRLLLAVVIGFRLVIWVAGGAVLYCPVRHLNKISRVVPWLCAKKHGPRFSTDRHSNQLHLSCGWVDNLNVLVHRLLHCSVIRVIMIAVAIVVMVGMMVVIVIVVAIVAVVVFMLMIVVGLLTALVVLGVLTIVTLILQRQGLEFKSEVKIILENLGNFLVGLNFFMFSLSSVGLGP